MKELTAVTPNIHRLVIPFLDIYTTVFIVTTEEGAVLFDTATYPSDIDEYIVPALKELGITAEALKYVVISHNHRDHAGGLERFAQLYPGTTVVAGSDRCGERIPGRTVRVLADGEMLTASLKAVSMPGHTDDAMGILDTRTKTLLSGDCLQLYGIYGSGNWGANIRFIPEHLALGKHLAEQDIEMILACHDYHPCGWRADGKAEVRRYIDQCANALYAIRDFMRTHPEPDDEALAALYNGASGLPTVAPKVFTAIRAAMEAKII